MKKLAYLACPYNHPLPEVRKKRLFFANYMAFQLITKGDFVYSPLTHNIPLNQIGVHGNWEMWRELDLLMLSRCDKLIILKLEGWEFSQGVTAEIEHAKTLGLPIEEIEAPSEKLLDISPDLDALHSLLHRMFQFYRERDWEQFHSPKNVAMDLATEVGEILEHFRWLTEEQSYQLNGKQLEDVRDEIGDAFKALVYLAAKLNVDPIQAAHRKLAKMAQKYPADLCKGRCDKYTAYSTTENNA